MEILILIVKTVIAYLVIMFLSTNLLGFFVRGIIPSVQGDINGYLIETDIKSTKSIMLTISSFLIILIYIFFLYEYFNYGMALAAIIIMIARLPDLLMEMKTGDKKAYKSASKKPIGILTSAMTWGVFPLIYYSFCCL
jgi:hypothetical protein